jgi:molybdopterin molybdotransferase
MRPFTHTISLDEARAIIERSGTEISRVERVSIEQAQGRVLARDVVASSDVPPFSRAAMDGYAVRSADTRGASRSTPKTVHQIATLYTGHVSPVAISEGECIEIATGAPLPDGADAVVMVEETDATEDGRIRLYAEVHAQQNVGRRGADLRSGEVVLTSGTTLNSSRLGALAAVGVSTIDVYARPRVAVLSTGNEVAEPGEPLKPGHIYDINRFTLSAVVAENGGEPVALSPVPDTIDAIGAALDRSLTNDIVVFSGGSSVGERDLMVDVLSSRGTLLFHGISIKPGKPTGFALVDGKPVFAMPGYPASCLTNAHILLVPLLRRMARLGPKPTRTIVLPLAERALSAPGRHQFFTVRIVDGSAVPAFKASGDITSMSRADGYIEIPAEVSELERGSLVEVTLF